MSDAPNIDRVRIPPELMHEISDFFSALGQSVLRQGVVQADARTAAGEICVMRREDVLRATPELLDDVRTAFEEAFGLVTTQHARRAT
jgi:hypothetical protein